MVFLYYRGLFCRYSGLPGHDNHLNIICRFICPFLNSVRNSSIVLTSFGKYVAHTPTFFRHMTVTGTKCKISILPCICRCFHTCCKRCTSIEHLHTIQTAHHSLDSPPGHVIIAEWMRCKTNASLCFYKIYKILCRIRSFG